MPFQMSQEQYIRAQVQLADVQRQNRAWQKVIDQFEQYEFDLKETMDANQKMLWLRNHRPSVFNAE